MQPVQFVSTEAVPGEMEKAVFAGLGVKEAPPHPVTAIAAAATSTGASLATHACAHWARDRRAGASVGVNVGQEQGTARQVLLSRDRLPGGMPHSYQSIATLTCETVQFAARELRIGLRCTRWLTPCAATFSASRPDIHLARSTAKSFPINPLMGRRLDPAALSANPTIVAESEDKVTLHVSIDHFDRASLPAQCAAEGSMYTGRHRAATL
ncbi:MAG TPA: hypothetical protein VFI20_02890 [Terracidiphilus sp.]|nr:hypothetical protein [Terracidiphilus sp.]